MKTNYVLIDFENVQPSNLEALKEHNFKVIVFVGANQTKVSFELASAMQSLGDCAEYVKIEGNGSNSLDFHIAFYVGSISEKDKSCHFHIISKDKGFDPLIKHLKSKKIFIQRKSDISEIPLLKNLNISSKSEQIDTIIEFLRSRGEARPRTVKTLSNSIDSLFMKCLEDIELEGLLKELISTNIVVKNGAKVTYNLPK